MASDSEVRIKVVGDTKDYEKAIGKADRKTEELFGTTNKIIDRLPKLSTIAVAAFGALGAAITKAVSDASKFEDVAVQFNVLTGSVTESKRVIEELQKFSAGTPFQFEGIADATKQLLGFGFTSDEVIGKLGPLGDVAAAIGVPLTDLSLIFGQVRAAGKLTGERLLQLQERAVPIGAALAKSLNVPEEAVKNLVSQGKISFADFEKAFKSISEEGGIAFEGMKQKSETLSGRISTLKDNINILSGILGSSLVPVLKTSTSELTQFVQNLAEIAKTDALTKLTKNRDALYQLDEAIKEVNADIEKRKQGGSIAQALFGPSGSDLDAQLNIFKTKKAELLAERDDLRKLVSKDSEVAQKDAADRAAAQAEKDRAAAQEKLQRESELNASILTLKQNHEDELTGLSEEKLLERQARLDELNLEKENLDIEKRALELETKGQHADALALIDENLTKREAVEIKKRLEILKKDKADREKLEKERLALEQKFSQSRVDVATAAANLIVAVAGRENKLAFAIAKAAAIAQSIVSTNLAAANALVVDPTGALSASVTLAGRLNTAAIIATALQGFAEGGIVGGRLGTDVNPAMLTRGEIVAPTQNFDEVIGSVRALREAEKIQGGGLGGSEVNVTIGFTEDAVPYLEQKFLERRAIGVGSL
ncbi:MAG: tape measure protein [Bdellovibrionales bacterium]|nr:tape measure protein [Bdellovibrionales bacterium]